MSSEILVTGGTGKTGRRLVTQLRSGSLSPKIATRSPTRNGEVRFDWAKADTFDAAFTGIKAVYLVAPSDTVDPITAMRPGLARALLLGVRRFVLLSASSLEMDGPMMGGVHRFLHDNAPEWIILRPTWFMQNLSELQHRPTICDEGAIYSATGDGRVSFIDASDIASVAMAALITQSMPNGELILTGPEALSYDDVAAILTSELGRPIVHKRLSETEMAERFADHGIPPEYAKVLASMDTAIACGTEDRTTDCVNRIAHRQPTSMSQFASENRATWLKL